MEIILEYLNLSTSVLFHSFQKKLNFCFILEDISEPVFSCFSLSTGVEPVLRVSFNTSVYY